MAVHPRIRKHSTVDEHLHQPKSGKQNWAPAAIEEKVCVLILDPCETGKNHIAQALGHCGIRAGHDVLFAMISRMLYQLSTPLGRPTAPSRPQWIFFIINDFGLKPFKGAHKTRIFTT